MILGYIGIIPGYSALNSDKIGLYWDNIWFYRENGKENGNYDLGFRV